MLDGPLTIMHSSLEQDESGVSTETYMRLKSKFHLLGAPLYDSKKLEKDFDNFVESVNKVKSPEIILSTTNELINDKKSNNN